MGALEQLSGACPVRAAEPQDHVDGVPAQVVARPRSTEETSTLLRACHEQGLAVVVRGHGTKLAWGRPPERVDVILETTGMAELVEHARGDLVATAGAGMPLRTLSARLAEGGHQLVLDDLVGDVAAVGTADGSDRRGSTLGGALSTNLCGPRRMWAGSVRDLVIGVRFVRADGTVAKAGGKVVKNVAGYDLAKLLTGSYGTLAVVTEVIVRLHPLPEAQRWVTLTVPAAALATVLGSAVHSQTVPQALEVRAGPGQDPVVAVLLGGTTAGVQARAARLAEALAPHATGSVPAATVTEGAPQWWARPVAAEGGDVRPVLLRSTTRISGVAELVAAAVGEGMTVTGSAGVGVLYATLPGDRAPEEARAAVEAVRGASTRLGGSTVVLDAPPATKAVLDSWGPVPGLDLMRRVKNEFDPTRALAPGRFVGGL